MKKIKEEKRETVIIKTSIIGIFINLLLVIFKAIIGLISNSIAILLDAVMHFHLLLQLFQPR